MTRRASVRVGLGAVVGLGAACALGIGPNVLVAHAAGAETAWWSQQGTAPAVPAGGLYISHLPNVPGVTGPQTLPTATPAPFVQYAMAALRRPVTPGVDATVVLHTAANNSARVNGTAVAITACGPADSAPPWKTNTGNGAWADRATPACDSFGADGVVSTDGTSVTFTIPGAFQRASGVLDVILVTKGATPYQIAFNKPTDADVTSLPEPVAEPSPQEPSATPSTTPASTDNPTQSVGAPSPSGEAPPVSGFSSPDVPVGAGVTDSTAAPATNGTTQTARIGGAQATKRLATVPTASRSRDSQSARTVALLGLVILGGALFWLGSQRARTPRLLGSVGGSAAAEEARRHAAHEAAQAAAGAVRSGGVGRFQRARVGNPPVLR